MSNTWPKWVSLKDGECAIISSKMASKKTKAIVPQNETALPDEAANRLFGEIRPLIEEIRGRVAQTVNAATVLLYWHIGEKIGSLGMAVQTGRNSICVYLLSTT